MRNAFTLAIAEIDGSVFDISYLLKHDILFQRIIAQIYGALDAVNGVSVHACVDGTTHVVCG